MKKYNFDIEIDRRGTDATKYERMDAVFGRHDLTPLWIADLDFAVCPDIVEALRHRMDHPVFGYSDASGSYWDSIIGWNRLRHGLEVSRADLAFVPGVVKGLGYAVNYFTSPGDAVVIQPPVYTPFRTVVEGNGRRVAENPLVCCRDHYEMDLEGLEEVIAASGAKLMILCNPHNPIGIQWDEETLKAVADICLRHNVVVVSDEIHGDLVLGGKPHIPFVAVSDAARQVGVMLGAPSKTFNIPGLVSSWMVVKDEALRSGFYNWLAVNEFSSPVMFSTIGAESAYRHGEQWLDEMLAYVEANIEFATRYIQENIPEVGVYQPQASFLLWLDFRKLHMAQPQIMDMLMDRAHLALNDGTMFGVQGTGFARMNVGVPRKVLSRALESLRSAVNENVMVH